MGQENIYIRDSMTHVEYIGCHVSVTRTESSLFTCERAGSVQISQGKLSMASYSTYIAWVKSPE